MMGVELGRDIPAFLGSIIGGFVWDIPVLFFAYALSWSPKGISGVRVKAYLNLPQPTLFWVASYCGPRRGLYRGPTKKLVG